MTGVLVQGPAAAKYRYGLQSVATVVDAADDHEFWDGVTWEADCPTAPMTTLAANLCEPNTAKSLAAPNIDQDATPFRGYSGLFCKLPGRPALLDRASTVFDLSEWQYVEDQAWTGSAGGTPFVSQFGVTDVTPVVGTAVSMQEGGGLLCQWLASELGQEGVIWSPRTLAYWWANKGLVSVQGPTLRDPVGNAIVLAAGGHFIGPWSDAVTPGVAPAAGKYWLYATGPVMVRRQSKLQPALESALDRKENEVFGIVERSYLVLWACAQAAVLVDPLLPAGV